MINELKSAEAELLEAINDLRCMILDQKSINYALTSCFHKIKYSSVQECEPLAKKTGCRPYECSICGDYHITSKELEND